ncbi:nitrate/nitrite two-component system sensor histidine kinase NarQ, partial [Vibrio vulnificus]|nr:nitrate/nitrite two-component system sensor histidine kinase NarQ [Vibrio vulnificus]
SKAANIRIECCEEGEWVTVSVSDDGVGFDQCNQKLNHYGMSIMQERAARLNGSLSVTASPQNGCAVVLKYQRIKETRI